MKLSEFDNLIPKEIPVPECPTDKFVAGFLAQMDNDMAANTPVANGKNLKTGNHFPKYIGAIAATFLIVFGVSVLNRDMVSGLLFQKNEKTPIVAHTITDDEVDDYYYNLYSEGQISAQDAFASQLIGYHENSNENYSSDVSY